jgi:hypothetical protein
MRDWALQAAVRAEDSATKDVASIAAEIRYDGRVLSAPSVHVLVGTEAGIRQGIEREGRIEELDVSIRVERDARRPGRYTGVFVYRFAGEETTVTERWRRDTHVEHAVGPVAISLDLSAP